MDQKNPCDPSPCGPYSLCKVTGDQPSCSCKAKYIGSPPNCRPECVTSSECPFNLACIQEKCQDPCLNSCGINTECRVISHTPNCLCMAGYIGDPFIECNLQPQAVVTEISTPCIPSPCGSNAICKEQNGAGSCSCAPDYIGNPYEGCRPECLLNSDCPANKACIGNKCKDPCPGTCGSNAACQVINHLPTCTCIEGFTGNPFTICTMFIESKEFRISALSVHIKKSNYYSGYTEKPRNPCFPSPCGPNSQCRVNSEQAVCTCLPNYVGSPPGCRPECVVNSECPSNKACIGQKCANPCPGTCGLNAKCLVKNHSPICSCKESFTGDPFTRCLPLQSKPLIVHVILISKIYFSSSAIARYTKSLFPISMWTKFTM